MSGRKHEQDYWVSYSDLSTGLMIVFMLVMLLQLLQIRQAQEAHTESLKELVSEINRTATARRDIAVALQEKLHPVDVKISVDPVTAQIDIPDGFVSFGERNWRIPPADRGRLAQLVVAYVDAVNGADCKERQGDCAPIDETRLGSIRRVLVTGHADLVGNAAENHWLSAMRAEVVVQFSADLLRCAAGMKPRELPRGPIAGAVNTWAEAFICPDPATRCVDPSPEMAPICASPRDLAAWQEIWRWVEPRLHAAGAGDLEHCQAVAGTLGPISCDAALSTARPAAPTRRRISLELDVVGSDFTGLVRHTVQLCDKELATPETCETANALFSTILAECERDPTKYAVCLDAGLDLLRVGAPVGPTLKAAACAHAAGATAPAACGATP